MTVLASTERKPKRIGLIPTSGALGAQVTGVDLSQPLDDETFAEIEQAFYDNLVLVFIPYHWFRFSRMLNALSSGKVAIISGMRRSRYA